MTQINFISFKEFHDLYIKSGIYCIRNKTNGVLYIGSSECIPVRINQHFLKDRRESSLLMRVMKDNGIENFDVSILELCKESILNDREKFWYHFLLDSGYKLYNKRIFSRPTKNNRPRRSRYSYKELRGKKCPHCGSNKARSTIYTFKDNNGIIKRKIECSMCHKYFNVKIGQHPLYVVLE